MSILFFTYLFIIYFIGYLEFKKTKNVTHYTISSKNASWYLVGGSIIASCIGGSATIGVISLSYEVGFPAIWWLLSGASGLLVLCIFLAKKIAISKALTMPEMIEYYIGKKARFVASIIIVLAWSSILAAQLLASAWILAAILKISFNFAVFVSAFIIVTYSILAGQASILKSDLAQSMLMFITFFIIILWFIFAKDVSIANLNFELLNDKFTISRWSYFMLIIGGSYVVCPMLFGRVLSAKSKFDAKFGVAFGVIGIIIGAIMVVLIGLISQNFINPTVINDQILTKDICETLPPFLGAILLVVLFSAIISSADSCLITASSVFCNDILKTKSLKIYRVFTILFGLFALLLTFGKKNILGYLLGANDIYVSGVVLVVFMAMISKKKLNENICLLAMIIGGGIGLIGAMSDEKIYSFIALILAFIISILAHFKGEIVEARNQ
ncbi:sodium:solute symporter family protein [Campylobacter ureolyticus]|uniref:sodium:solute symporter family protein n=1 Tax=Campylobacter ureolyticus TaxID=827 RepID=UPI0022B33D68|nr:sodium:solute symporter family protein [Campylobacter ureolyticus]MCZ6111144.1 sodium:solute symporter family protein [Campylobacter ureolyticus]